MALVLVVDDDDEFRALAVRVVTSWGHVTSEADSVSQALIRAGELRPDAVLTDVGLPDGDGFDLAEKLTDSVGPVPIVLVSSDPERTSEDFAARVGASGFVPKDQLSSPLVRDLLNL